MVTVKDITIYPSVTVVCEDTGWQQVPVKLSGKQVESLHGLKMSEIEDAVCPMVPVGYKPIILQMTVPFFFSPPKTGD